MKPSTPEPVVIDTNVFVGAAFNPGSSSAAVVRSVQNGLRTMPWTDATRGEIEHVLGRIPPLSRRPFEGLFLAGQRKVDGPDERDLDWVGDPEDRKFAALARATGAVLVSSDRHLLSRRQEASITVLTPREFTERLRQDSAGPPR